jgi:hypothetical protein
VEPKEKTKTEKKEEDYQGIGRGPDGKGMSEGHRELNAMTAPCNMHANS